MFSNFFKSLSCAKKIAFIAVFIALSVASNTLLDIDIPPKNKITFTYFIGFASAYLLGGLPAAAIAFVGDGLGWILAPDGPYWLYGVTNALYAFLVGVILHGIPMKGKAADYIKTGIAVAVCFLVCTICVNSFVDYTYAIVYLWGGQVNKSLFVYLAAYFPPRIAIQSAVYVGNVILCFALLPVFDRFLLHRNQHKKAEVQGA